MKVVKETNKYGTKTEYKGTEFRSKFEAGFAKYLDNLGLKWEYETLSLPYVARMMTYTPDFKVWRPGGGENDWFIVETKGWFDNKSRQKMLQIKRQYPHFDIKLFFQRPELFTTKNKLLTYETWSKKYKIDVLTKDYLHSLVGNEKIKLELDDFIPPVDKKPKTIRRKRKPKVKKDNEKISV